jgi:ABC-2 type transport system ATP-binding protein
MPGASGFEQDEREARLYVFPQGRQPRLGDAVADRLRQRGVAFGGLRQEHGRLDEVFRRITTAKPASSPAAKGAA